MSSKIFCTDVSKPSLDMIANSQSDSVLIVAVRAHFLYKAISPNELPTPMVLLRLKN